MMKQKTDCAALLAGVEVPLALRFPETAGFFQAYICPVPTEIEPLYADDRLWEKMGDVEKEEIPGPWAEFYQLTGLVSRFLLAYNRCVFHGVALLWKERAWIITGPSGVGKTTQLRQWQKLFEDEFELISGDKPILEYREYETIWVHPSPWNGKENYSGKKGGKLAGIIYLVQADHNEIEKMDIHHALVPIFCQFLIYADNAEEILAAGRLEEQMLRAVPVWKLLNRGDAASAELTQKTLLEYLEGKA